ncbi:hypothetical protein LINGRAHAP2_LOCUS9217 [Linum grandiflorum]
MRSSPSYVLFLCSPTLFASSCPTANNLSCRYMVNVDTIIHALLINLFCSYGTGILLTNLGDRMLDGIIIGGNMET